MCWSSWSQNPVLQQAHVINGALVVQGLNAVESPVVCQSAKETLVEMIQGNGPSFAVLKGACLTLSQQCRASISLAPACIFYFIVFADAPILCHHHHTHTGTSLEPLASCAVEQDNIVFPDNAWQQSASLLPCLAELATTTTPLDAPPPMPDGNDVILQEHDAPMNPQEVMNLLEQLVAMTNQASPGGTGPVASVVRTLAQQASADGPLRLFGGQPDVRGGMELFQQHLQAIATLLNTLHDPKVLGEFLHASNFPRAKYELFALHHMQLLVWLQRVQTGMQAGMFKQGPDAQQFLTQIAHAARVLLFQPLLQHIHAVMMTVSKIQADTSGVEVPRSMRWRCSTRRRRRRTSTASSGSSSTYYYSSRQSTRTPSARRAITRRRPTLRASGSSSRA